MGGVAVGARVEAQRAVGERGGERAEKAAGFGCGEHGGLGEEMGEGAGRGVECLAVAGDEPPDVVGAEQRADGQFVGVGGAGCAQSGAGGDERGEPGSAPRRSSTA